MAGVMELVGATDVSDGVDEDIGTDVVENEDLSIRAEDVDFVFDVDVVDAGGAVFDGDDEAVVGVDFDVEILVFVDAIGDDSFGVEAAVFVETTVVVWSAAFEPGCVAYDTQ